MTALLALAGEGGAGADPEISLTDFELRLSFFDQTGEGYQSRAGPIAGPGSESTWIVQPQIYGRLRHDHWTHDAVINVDIVSSASTDALDAISSASRMNEAVGADVTSSHKSGDETVSLRYGLHIEESIRSLLGGAGYERSLADDNATLGGSLLLMVDSVDKVPWQGGRAYETGERLTANLNLTASQILSPTTLVDGAYGLTAQIGQLATSYNSVPIGLTMRAGEVFDGPRLRHALRGRLAQHIPLTRSTLQLGYRFYVDNYGLTAHTAELQAYQYLADWVYVRVSHRLHHQSGVDFFATDFSEMQGGGPRTSDSDLAPFTSQEIGLKLRVLGERSPFDAIARAMIDAAFYRYWRTNDLVVNWFGMSLGYRF